MNAKTEAAAMSSSYIKTAVMNAETLAWWPDSYEQAKSEATTEAQVNKCYYNT